jgi:hypothetical protein
VRLYTLERKFFLSYFDLNNKFVLLFNKSASFFLRGFKNKKFYAFLISD